MWGMVAFLAAKALLETNSEIKVAKAQNRAAMSQLGKQINQVNAQRSQSLRQTSQALFNIDQSAAGAQGQIQLQAAASDTMGASVKDAVSTVNIVRDRQESNVYQQQDAQMEQYRFMVQHNVDQAHNSMDWESGTDKLWNNLMSAAGVSVGKAAGNFASGSDDSAPAGVSAAEGTQSIFSDPGSSVDTKSYGYDLWGRNTSSGDASTSWKSYLNK